MRNAFLKISAALLMGTALPGCSAVDRLQNIGQAPKLFVTLRENETATVPEILEFLSERLNKIEMPKAVEIRDSLPKTMVGKLSKKELVAEEIAKFAK